MKLEHCLKLGPVLPPAAQAAKIVSSAAAYDRFYIGEEFCENLLPGPERLAAFAGALLTEGKKVCVLTPPVSDRGLAALEKLFSALEGLGRRAGDLELTVNDFGALALARRRLPGFVLGAGRALYRNAFRADKNSIRVIDPRALDGFAELGVRRFEVPAGRGLKTNFSEGAGVAGRRKFSLTMYYPYSSVTSARSCLLGTPAAARYGTASYVDCRRECLAASFEITNPCIKEKFFMRGNALFLKLAGKPGPERRLLAARIDRLVYDPSP